MCFFIHGILVYIFPGLKFQYINSLAVLHALVVERNFEAQEHYIRKRSHFKVLSVVCLILLNFDFPLCEIHLILKLRRISNPFWYALD